jgi:hypothetical protein
VDPHVKKKLNKLYKKMISFRTIMIILAISLLYNVVFSSPILFMKLAPLYMLKCIIDIDLYLFSQAVSFGGFIGNYFIILIENIMMIFLYCINKGHEESLFTI